MLLFTSTVSLNTMLRINFFGDTQKICMVFKATLSRTKSFPTSQHSTHGISQKLALISLCQQHNAKLWYRTGKQSFTKLVSQITELCRFLYEIKNRIFLIRTFKYTTSNTSNYTSPVKNLSQIRNGQKKSSIIFISYVFNS